MLLIYYQWKWKKKKKNISSKNFSSPPAGDTKWILHKHLKLFQITAIWMGKALLAKISSLISFFLCLSRAQTSSLSTATLLFYLTWLREEWRKMIKERGAFDKRSEVIILSYKHKYLNLNIHSHINHGTINSLGLSPPHSLISLPLFL